MDSSVVSHPYTLLDFPEEILARIIHFLRSGKSHCSLAQTCSYFRYRVFSHVRQLNLLIHSSEFVERLLPKYPNLSSLTIFRGIPDIASLVHLTNIHRFHCVTGFIGKKEARQQMTTRMDDIAEWLISQPLEMLTLSWKYLSAESIKRVLQIPTLRIISNIIHAEMTPLITPNLEYMRLSLLKKEVPTLKHLKRLRQLHILASVLDRNIAKEIKHLKTLKILTLSLHIQTDLTLLTELPMTTLYLRTPSFRGSAENLDLTPLRQCLKLRHLSIPSITSAQLEPLLTHPNARKVRNSDNKPYLICRVRMRPVSLCGSIHSVYNKLKKLEQRAIAIPVENIEDPDDEISAPNEEWHP